MVAKIIFYTNAAKLMLVYNNGGVQKEKVVPYPEGNRDAAWKVFQDWYETNADTIDQQNIHFSWDIRDDEII